MTSIPFTYECSKAAGFVPDPNEHKRFGYVTALKIGTTEPAADLKVNVPTGAAPVGFTGLGYAAPAAANKSIGEAKVVGVIEKFEWNGGVGDPLKLEFYVSRENATQIKAVQQSTLVTTKVDSLGWWIADYDQEVKKWYEQAYPIGNAVIGNAVSGIIAGKENPELNVDLSPVPAKDGIDLNVYRIAIGIVPAANKQYTLHFANSHQTKVAKPWGLVVGKLAQA